MKNLSNFQFFPIVNDRIFEEFVCDIFNDMEKTNTYDLFGRKGQNQYGIDIYSSLKATVIQCKHKIITRADQKIREELLTDFKNELDRFKSFNEAMGGHFKKFIVASTYKNDTHLAAECIKLSIEHNIAVEYWSWDRLTRYIKGDIFDNYYEFLRNSLELYYGNTKSLTTLIPINRQDPFVKQVYDFLSVRFRDIRILHSRMFLNQNVLERGLNDYSRRSVFTYRSYNENFYKLFADLEFKDDRLVDNFSQDRTQFHMLDFITRTFSENGIRTILGTKYGEVKTIINRVQEPVDYVDHFEKFKFIEVFSKLPIVSDESPLEEIQRQGYFYYKIGDYLRAKDLFQMASVRALEQDRKISYLIAQHNLLHLGKFIEWGYYGLAQKNEIVQELKSISLDEIEVDGIDQELKDTIVRSSFFTSAKEIIQSYTDKIEEFYYSHLRGIQNSVNFENELDYEYSTLHSFISKNYIVYDEYSDYKQIIHNLFKALLASYSIEGGRNKIKSLNDFHLYHLVEYGDKNQFEKYLKRYNLYEIEYEKYEDQDYQFVRLFSNFAANSTSELNVFLEENDQNFVSNFKERYKNIFLNFVFFSGVLKLECEDLSILTGNIFKVIESSIISERFAYKSVYDFFIRKCTGICQSDLIRFVFYAVAREELYDLSKLIAFLDELHYNKIILDLSDEQFKIITGRLESASNDTYNEHHLQVTLAAVLAPLQKKFLSELLEEKLNKEYDSDLCHMMLIYELFDCRFKEYFDMYAAAISIPHNNKDARAADSPNDPDFNRNDILDGFFNIAFKYELSFPDDCLTRLAGISNYYDWLLDIDSFDYSKFNPYWIDGYGSMYYYRHMKKHDVLLKREVQKHIVKNQDERLKRIFYNIFCSDNL